MKSCDVKIITLELNQPSSRQEALGDL